MKSDHKNKSQLMGRSLDFGQVFFSNLAVQFDQWGRRKNKMCLFFYVFFSDSDRQCNSDSDGQCNSDSDGQHRFDLYPRPFRSRVM